MVKRIPLQPRYPERICWGCERYCPATSMACGNGSERTPHPIEMFGERWFEDDPVLGGAVAGPAAQGIPPFSAG